MFSENHRLSSKQSKKSQLSAYHVYAINFLFNDNECILTLYVHNGGPDTAKHMEELYNNLRILKFDTQDGFTREFLPKELPTILKITRDNEMNTIAIHFNLLELAGAFSLLTALCEDSVITKDQKERCLLTISKDRSSPTPV